jgi:hypothetical protein
MQLHLLVTAVSTITYRRKKYLRRVCRLTDASIEHCTTNNIFCLNLTKDTGRRNHDGQLVQMQARGMEAGYNVHWFRCPDCKLGPTTLAMALDSYHWECDGLDAQTGRTTHNDNTRRRSGGGSSSCPRQADFLNELHAGDMQVRCIPCHRRKSNAERSEKALRERSGGGGSSGDGNGAPAKKTKTNTITAYFGRQTNSN